MMTAIWRCSTQPAKGFAIALRFGDNSIRKVSQISELSSLLHELTHLYPGI